MAHLHGLTVGILVISLLWCLLAPPSPGSAAAARPTTRGGAGLRADVTAAARRCDAGGWSALTLPGARRSMAMDVISVAGRAAWVVGMHAGRGTARSPWAVRRSARGWRSVAMPRVGTDSGLVAVDAVSSAHAWSVGFRAEGRDLRPVAMRWARGRWQDVSPAWRSRRSAALTDVSVGPEVWAVGYRTGPSGPRPFALAWRSGAWRRHDPSLGSGFGALTATAAIPRRGTWAAGWASRGRAIAPAVWRWQRAGWVRERLPRIPGTEAVLTGLTVNGRELWAVGYRVDGTLLRPITLVRRASRWQSVEVPAAASSFLPDALHVNDGGRLAMVGSARRAAGSSLAHAVAIVDGGALRLRLRPAGIGGDSHLRAVTRDGRGSLSVGWTDGRALVLRTCAGPSQAPVEGRVPLDRPATRDAAPASRRALAAPSRPAVSAVQRTESATGRGTADHAAVRRVVFRDVAARKGLRMITVTYGAARLDADGDGWDDLLISRHQERGRLLLGRGGRFRPAAADPLPTRDRHGCAAADVDGDGADEAFCAIGAARGVKLKSNELFTRLPGRNRRNASGPLGLAEHLGRGRGAGFVALEGDEHPDLLVTSDPLRVDGLPSLSRLFRNDAGRGFRSAPELGLDLPIGGSCVLSAQLDGRGGQEIVICASDPWRGSRGLHVFRRAADRYVDATRALGLTPRGAVDAVAADLDGDGATDVAQLSTSQLVVSLQRGGKLRRVAARAIGHGVALAAGDVNADGLADLYVVRGGPGNAPDLLLINTGRGRTFRSASIPQARSGGADDVVALDHDHNGLTDFVVLNGHERAGPLQLIAAYRG